MHINKKPVQMPVENYFGINKIVCIEKKNEIGSNYCKGKICIKFVIIMITIIVCFCDDYLFSFTFFWVHAPKFFSVSLFTVASALWMESWIKRKSTCAHYFFFVCLSGPTVNII